MDKPHGRNLRRGRVSEAGRIYLVTTATFQRRPWFSDLLAGRAVVAALRGETERAETLCFCIMPDHLHWLLQLRDSAILSDCVQAVKSVSARTIKRAAGLSGAVWQRGFHDHALREEEDLLDVARYVVANPLRAGLVRRLGDYPLWDAVWV